MNQIYSILPSIRVFQLMGMWPFSISVDYTPKNCVKIKFYSVFLIVISILSFRSSFGAWHLYVNGTGDAGQAIDFFQLVGIRAAHIVVLLESLFQHKILMNFFVTVSEVDAMMKKIKIDIEFKKNRLRHYFLIGIFLMVYFGNILMVLLLAIMTDKPQRIGYWMSYIWPFMVGCIRYYQIFNFVWCIRKRLGILNVQLEQIHLIDTRVANKFVFNFHYKSIKISKPIESREKLLLLRQIYGKLHMMSVMINNAFGCSVLLNIANDFLALTTNSYFIFIWIQKWPISLDDLLSITQSVFWCLPHLFNVIAISILCHLTTNLVRFASKS